MDKVFKNLEKEGKTDVDNLIKWMKDSKLIEATKEGEQKARNMLKDAKDVEHVELAKFKEVVKKLAVEQKKSFEQLSKQLADSGQILLQAAMAGVQAFKEAIKSDGK